MFKFYSKITATGLGIQKFFLDAMTMFDRYLIFSNEDSLFVTNFEKFIESPQYFSPTQMKSIDLSPFFKYYSGNVFTETDWIPKLLVLDRWITYVSVFIHTRFYGTLMLEVPKAAFEYDDWNFETVSDLLPFTSKHNLDAIKYNLKDSKPVVQSGRILQNIYTYDYMDAEFIMNEKMMGILLKNHVDNIFSYYIIRIINLLTHEQSMVYKDIYILDANEWISLNLEEENSHEWTVIFSLLWDSAVFKYEVHLKEEFTINPKNDFWKDPEYRLFANISQTPIFGISSSSILVEIKVFNDFIGESSYWSFYGILMIIGIFTVSMVVLRLFCSEHSDLWDSETTIDDIVKKKTEVLKSNYELRRQTSRKSRQTLNLSYRY